MANCKLLLNDGSSNLLLNDGTSVLLLNDDTCAAGGVGGGIILSGTHATQAYFPGGRAEQLIPIEFTFRLISTLITKTGLRIRVKSVLEKITKSNIKVKSLLITREKMTVKFKSSLILRERVKTDKNTIKSTTLTRDNYRAGLFSKTRKNEKKQMKEKLLKKLKEIMDNE